MTSKSFNLDRKFLTLVRFEPGTRPFDFEDRFASECDRSQLRVTNDYWVDSCRPTSTGRQSYFQFGVSVI